MRVLLPLAVFGAGLAVWWAAYRSGLFHASALPSPSAVLATAAAEARSGRMFADLTTSLFRVSCGFLAAALFGIPLGLSMGQTPLARVAFVPALNFLRNLSPLAWIPFAILWFGVGDTAAIFLIFLSALFPIALATMAAVANIPAVYFQVAESYGMRGVERLWKVTLPAIMPQLITTLRVTAGLSWLVVVAAEMIAGRDGLGFAVMDSRNGLRMDLLVTEMIVIGSVGVFLDRVLVRLTHIPSVRWGYEK